MTDDAPDIFREICRTVQARSIGRTQQEVGDDLRAELERAGLTIPEDRIRWNAEAMVNALAGRPTVVSLGRSSEAFKAFRALGRLFRDAPKSAEE